MADVEALITSQDNGAPRGRIRGVGAHVIGSALNSPASRSTSASGTPARSRLSNAAAVGVAEGKARRLPA